MMHSDLAAAVGKVVLQLCILLVLFSVFRKRLICVSLPANHIEHLHVSSAKIQQLQQTPNCQL